MTVQLLPRLTALGVETVFDECGEGLVSPDLAQAILRDRPTLLSYAASGGTRSEAALDEVGAALTEIGRSCGFPDNTSQVARSKFDREAATYLATAAPLASGEALRDDVWAYLATVVVPDLVTWRFPSPATHRFKGGIRNAFQRLWTRGTVLDRGPDAEDRWKLVRSLSEDAAVQIFERASIGGSRPLALAVAEAWVRIAGEIGRGAMEPVMRRATVLIRLRNEILDFANLPTSESAEIVESCFQLAARHLMED